jgi:ferredoxin
MVKYKIEFDREACIGALACNAVSPKFWELAKDGKVDLKGAILNKETKKWELTIGEEDFKLNDDAAYSCPVHVIKITRLPEEDGEKNGKEEEKKETKVKGGE